MALGITGANAVVGISLYIVWLHKEPNVGGAARPGKTLSVWAAHRPHSIGPYFLGSSPITLTLANYNPNSIWNGYARDTRNAKRLTS